MLGIASASRQAQLTDGNQSSLRSKLSRSLGPHRPPQHVGICLVLSEVSADLDGQED